ncbi:MAG: DUF5701 family protein [Marmoricola sp.]
MRWRCAPTPTVRSSPIPTFERPIDRLVTLGYPTLAGTSEEELRELVEPLRSQADAITGADSPSRVRFVLVVTRDVVPPESTVPLLRLSGPRGLGEKPGKVDRNHAEGDLADYHPIAGCEPPGMAYLLVDVERGEEFRNVRPEDATGTIRSRGRSPLTIDEGIALVTQVPQVLEKNRCFMLAGSRRHDRRVPALWISENAPKLGWCWDGNPHTWLGTASSGSRLG